VQIRQAITAAAELSIPTTNPSSATGSAAVGNSWLLPH
jgi:hypothetical protein